MINIHIHTFKDCDIPVKFLPFGLVKVLKTKVGFFLLNNILQKINPFSNKDIFHRFSTFIKIGKGKSQEDILNMCADAYPKDTEFVVLPMDMAFMGAGRVPRPYEDQLIELETLSKKNTNVLPFVHIDTRRSNYQEIFNICMKSGFRGVKLYPPLGVFPYSNKFDAIYAHCEANHIPVLAHCTKHSVVYFKGSRSELLLLLRNSVLKVDTSLKNRDLCDYFMHPENYRIVFEKFPKLKVCLAHFGSGNEWDKLIVSLISEYKTLFVDISYALFIQERWAYLKVLLLTNEDFRNKCLFGSDWYMDSVEGEEFQFSIQLRAYLGEELWTIITVDNPKKYLYE